MQLIRNSNRLMNFRIYRLSVYLLLSEYDVYILSGTPETCISGIFRTFSIHITVLS